MLNRRMRGAGGIGPMYGTGKSTQSVDLCSLHSPRGIKTKKKVGTAVKRDSIFVSLGSKSIS